MYSRETNQIAEIRRSEVRNMRILTRLRQPAAERDSIGGCRVRVRVRERVCALSVRKRALEMWNYIGKRMGEDLKIGRTALFPSRFCVVGPFDAVDD